MYDSLLFGLTEEVCRSGYLLASYYIETEVDVDIVAKAISFAVGQTVGTWLPVPGVTREIKERHMGKVVSIFNMPPRDLAGTCDGESKQRFIFEIAFPPENFGLQFPMMLTTLLGNDASTSAQVKLIDLKFPEGFLKRFSGPKFGISGIRDLLGVRERPLVLNMIKPCTGFSPEEGARLFYEPALGGVDIIKDDELLGNPEFNPLKERVARYLKVSERVYEETGHRVFYAPNITDRINKIRDNALRAIDVGANMVMLNFIMAGPGVLMDLAEDPDIRVPIIVHYAGIGVFSESERSGVTSPILLGKFARIAGADAVVINSPYGNYSILGEKYIQTVNFLRLPLLHLKPAFPAIGGGVHPGLIPRILSDLGSDIILAVGGAIQGHPGGAASGAKAMCQAIDAALSGRSLEDAAQDHDELKVAISRWPVRG